jgi:hypothetical protein
MVTESLAIALAAGALGTMFAVGGVRALVACLPAGFPRAAEIRLDSAVFGFTLLVAVLTGLLFGLVPALTASRTDLQQSLREGGRGAGGSGRQLRLRNFLVVGETGLACMLLIAAALMLHSFVNLLQADAGFRPQQVLTASISLPNETYRGEAQGSTPPEWEPICRGLATTRTWVDSWWKAAPRSSTTRLRLAITRLRPTISVPWEFRCCAGGFSRLATTRALCR